MDLDVASIITATGGVLALLLRAWSTRGRSGRAKALEDRVRALENQLLEWAGWAHTARVTAASNGVRLPAIPTPRAGSDSQQPEGIV